LEEEKGETVLTLMRSVTLAGPRARHRGSELPGLSYPCGLTIARYAGARLQLMGTTGPASGTPCAARASISLRASPKRSLASQPERPFSVPISCPPGHRVVTTR
jgi:hypothetical protein